MTLIYSQIQEHKEQPLAEKVDQKVEYTINKKVQDCNKNYIFNPLFLVSLV